MADIKFVVEDNTSTQDGKQEIELFDSKVFLKDPPQYTTHEDSTPYTPNSTESEDDKEITVRLDKWLWAARFFKTRALARTAVENSKVLYNGKVTSPNTEIEVGSTITIFPGKYPRIDLVIRGLSTRRRNAVDANDLFTQIKAPISFHSDNEHNNFRSRHSHPYCRKGPTPGKEPNRINNYENNYSQPATRKRNSTTRFLRGRKQQKDSSEQVETGFSSDNRY